MGLGGRVSLGLGRIAVRDVTATVESLDLITAWHVRAAAGFNFHFPVKLVFPFFELGFCF